MTTATPYTLNTASRNLNPYLGLKMREPRDQDAEFEPATFPYAGRVRNRAGTRKENT